ncbi:O-antigen ligase family protein [Acidipila rosea]|uniref:O-antigen ligase n=1 Tax=Acidipila rosea TaxID=768535 RepID=A0A4V2PVU1_9BACT|nr:O-antigen ligase family protein [Acidipila rosea]TCK75531.1 O-antigen ligase [Acidipila rosea]
MDGVFAVLILLTIIYYMVRGFSKPYLGLFVLTAALELQPGELYPVLGYFHIERVLVLALTVACFMQGKKLRFPPITKAFLAFYGAMLLGIPMAFWVGNSIGTCLQFFETVFCVLMAVTLLETEEQIKKYLVLMLSLELWLGASAVYMYHMGVRQFAMGIDRAEGLTSAGGDPNTLGITMVVSMPLAFLMMQKGNPKRLRIFGLIAVAISLVTIITTGSRTAFAAFLLLLSMIVFSKKQNLKFIPLVVLALPLLWLVIPQQYKLRYESVRDADEDESYTNRLLSWQGGIKMFEHNPLTGVGPGNYTFANGSLYWPGNPRHWLNAHSLYFKLLGELGASGTITFFAYVFMLFRLNIRLSKRFRDEGRDPFIANFPRSCSFCIILLLFTGYSAHNLYRSTWFMMGAISGAASLLAVRREAGEEKIMAKTELLPPWLPRRELTAETVNDVVISAQPLA